MSTIIIINDKHNNNYYKHIKTDSKTNIACFFSYEELKFNIIHIYN